MRSYDQRQIKKTLIQGIPVLLFIRALGVFFQFLVGLVIARIGGPAGLGAYQLYTAWMVTFSDCGSRGFPVLALREVARLSATGQHRKTLIYIYGLLSKGVTFCLPLGVCLLIVFWLIDTFLSSTSQIPIYVYLSVPCAIAFSLVRILLESRKARGNSISSVFIESILLPISFLILLAGFTLVFSTVSGTTIALFHTISVVLIFVVLIMLTFGSCRESLQKFRREDKIYMPSDMPAIWGGVVLNVVLLNLPFYILPLFVDLSGVGQFTVAYRLIALATTVLVVIASWYGPRISAAAEHGDHRKIRSELSQVRKLSISLFLPYLVLCIWIGDSVLLLFGNEFEEAYRILLILAVGQFVNAATGLPGLHLNMTRNGQLETNMAIMALTFGVLVMCLGGALFGVTGVACAFSLTVMFKNIGSLIFSHRILNRAEFSDTISAGSIKNNLSFVRNSI